MINLDIQKNLHGVNGNMNLDINLYISQGEFVCLYGENGSGKTSLLRILAGLEDAKANITINDAVWQDSNTKISVQKRNIGFVFQDYALFENMTVEENLLYVNKDIKLAHYLLQKTQILELRHRYPNKLSGGQKQRVSLCRAFMNKPKLLLMDEPLSALDINIRKKLQYEILALHKEFNTTTIMVSHDPSEIYKLASRVLVIHKGKLIKDGYPKDVLLNINKEERFTLEGEILDIKKSDVLYIAIVAISQQIIEVVISKEQSLNLNIGNIVSVSTKGFSPVIS